MILNINKGIRYFFFIVDFRFSFLKAKFHNFLSVFQPSFLEFYNKEEKKIIPLSLSLSLLYLSLSLSSLRRCMQHFVLNVDQNLCLLLCLQSNIQGTLAINWYWLNRSNVENDIYSKVFEIKSKSNLTM